MIQAPRTHVALERFDFIRPIVLDSHHHHLPPALCCGQLLNICSAELSYEQANAPPAGSRSKLLDCPDGPNLLPASLPTSNRSHCIFDNSRASSVCSQPRPNEQSCCCNLHSKQLFRPAEDMGKARKGILRLWIPQIDPASSSLVQHLSRLDDRQRSHLALVYGVSLRPETFWKLVSSATSTSNRALAVSLSISAACAYNHILWITWLLQGLSSLNIAFRTFHPSHSPVQPLPSSFSSMDQMSSLRASNNLDRAGRLLLSDGCNATVLVKEVIMACVGEIGCKNYCRGID